MNQLVYYEVEEAEGIGYYIHAGWGLFCEYWGWRPTRGWAEWTGRRAALRIKRRAQGKAERKARATRVEM